MRARFSLMLIASAFMTTSASHADPLVPTKKPTVQLIVEADGKRTVTLSCFEGDFSIRNNGKGDVAAVVVRGDHDGELTASGVITCEKRKD